MSTVAISSEQTRTNQVSIARQLAIFATFMSAVLASHFVDPYMAGVHLGGVFADWSWRYLVFAAIINLLFSDEGVYQIRSDLPEAGVGRKAK